MKQELQYQRKGKKKARSNNDSVQQTPELELLMSASMISDGDNDLARDRAQSRQ
jgi:hypothetical protein